MVRCMNKPPKPSARPTASQTPHGARRGSRPAAPFSVADRLAGVIDRLEGAIGRLRAGSPDAEAVHDVRVASRRLRGAIAAAREVSSVMRKTKGLGRRLKDVRTGLGGARQAEVGIALLESLRRELTAEEQPAAGAMAALLARRLEEFRAGLPATVRRLKLDRLPRDARALADRLEGTPPELPRRAALTEAAAHRRAPAVLRRAALAAVTARHQALVNLPRDPLDALDDAALHRFRIEAKKLRYTLEFFEPLFPGVEKRLEALREAQDLLGALHDLADLEALAADLAGRAREAGFESAAAPFERLGARLEQQRRADGRRFRLLHKALTDAGFLAGLTAAGREEKA